MFCGIHLRNFSSSAQGLYKSVAGVRSLLIWNTSTSSMGHKSGSSGSGSSSCSSSCSSSNSSSSCRFILNRIYAMKDSIQNVTLWQLGNRRHWWFCWWSPEKSEAHRTGNPQKRGGGRDPDPLQTTSSSRVPCSPSKLVPMNKLMSELNVMALLRRHDMETISALLAINEENPPVTKLILSTNGEFWYFFVLNFDTSYTNYLNTKSSCRLFGTLYMMLLWPHCNKEKVHTKPLIITDINKLRLGVGAPSESGVTVACTISDLLTCMATTNAKQLRQPKRPVQVRPDLTVLQYLPCLNSRGNSSGISPWPIVIGHIHIGHGFFLHRKCNLYNYAGYNSLSDSAPSPSEVLSKLRMDCYHAAEWSMARKPA